MIEILSSPKRLTKFEIVKAKSKIKFYFISHNKENKPNNLYLCQSNSSACNSLSLSLSLSLCRVQTKTSQNNSHLERVQQRQG